MWPIYKEEPLVQTEVFPQAGVIFHSFGLLIHRGWQAGA
jgi:hypothetical protein